MTDTAERSLSRNLERVRTRAAAEGLLDVAYATMDSPIGRLLLAATPQGLARIAFAEELDTAVAELAVRLSPRIIESPERLHPARRELDRYFAGRLTAFDVPIDRALIGSFASRVLERTAGIPYGSFASYRDVAREVGAPLAARAVGNALGSNPIPIVIPCHRVLRTGGSLGGYGGGVERKRFLLELEGALPAG